jgi:hypothetical protein
MVGWAITGLLEVSTRWSRTVGSGAGSSGRKRVFVGLDEDISISQQQDEDENATLAKTGMKLMPDSNGNGSDHWMIWLTEQAGQSLFGKGRSWLRREDCVWGRVASFYHNSSLAYCQPNQWPFEVMRALEVGISISKETWWRYKNMGKVKGSY